MLNPEQKKAVIYNKGPLLIVAGAGTGKTTVVVEKIKYLIRKKLARPEEILALTFTEKASSEMIDRVDQEMPYGYFQMWISTFHSFADQILKEEAPHIGLSPGYRLMSEAETIVFLKNNLFLFDLKYFRPLGNPNKFLESLLHHFSRLKDENITWNEYLDWAKKNRWSNRIEKQKTMELANAYREYQKLKIKKNLFDYGDLIYYLTSLFRSRKNILQKYQKKFKYVLVDEFQDTNIAQYDLLKLLCPPKTNPGLTVVGDDSQAIYKFRGASVSNILNFMKDFKKARQVTLIRNYRSNQEILNAAYRLIKYNDPDTLEFKLGISKKLIAQKKSQEKEAVKFFYFDFSQQEADFVAKEILELKEKHSFSDIAILTRANTHGYTFVNALIRNGIPFQFLGPSTIYRQPEVKDLIAYLKVLDNPEDSVSLFRVLSMDLFGIDIKDLTLLMSFSKKTNLALFSAIQTYLGFIDKEIYVKEYENYRNYLPLIAEDSRKKILRIYQMINKHLKKVKKDTAGQILFYFLEDSRLIEKLANYKSEKDEQIALNISKFFTKLKSLETDHEDASVSSVVDFINMSMELGESPTTQKTDIGQFNAVNIITAHSSKGLEFPIVFLVNLTGNRFPTIARRETLPIPDELIKEILPRGNYHLQEERRLFYVGITRAEKKVYMTAARFYGEGKRIQKISPFVAESIGEKALAKTIIIKKEQREQLSIFDFRKPKEIVMKKQHLNRSFSYTQLETFLRCPLQYKYQHIVKIPTLPTSSITFGNSIHKTLQNYYQQFLNEKSISLNELVRVFRKNWLPVGYSSASHEKRMKAEGEKILKSYYKKFHNRNLDVVAIEKPFKIKIKQNIYIVGKIDRVDRTAGNGLEIIDYKTGKKPDDKELKKSLQLSIYAMAANDRGLYNRNFSEITLSFYYLQESEKTEFKKTENEIMDTREKIIGIVDKIQTSDFKPSPGPWCDFCPFRMICEAWQ